MEFPYEKLDCYRLALEVARWVRTTPWPADAGRLRDECIRAADSVVLNIAEGSARRGKPGLNHFRIAHGSAGEACAALGIAGPEGAEAQRAKLRRVGFMLHRMA